MSRQRLAKDLTTEELRLLLIQKQRSTRQRRLEEFRRSGRISFVDAPPATAAQSTYPGSVLPVEESLPRRSAQPPRRIWLDRLLLIIEIGAVLGLVFVLFNGLSLLRSLNKEVASALQQPTLTPTPLIMAVVLPSGHTPPNAPGGVRPNEAEIPEHLRPLVQNLANLPIPTPSPEQAVRIQIPAINVDAPVVLGDGWEQLKKGVGQSIGTPNPGQDGNIVLSAHNDVFGEIFRDLDKLKNGDVIVLYTNLRTYNYVIQQTQIVEPTQVEVMAPTQEPVVTLISCYPYLVDDKRIVVRAHLQNQK